MKNSKILWVNMLTFSLAFCYNSFAQIENYRTPGVLGLNQFEIQKDSSNTDFSGLKVRIGGDFAVQFQGLQHSTKGSDTLSVLGSNFNLPTANLNIDAQLYDGVRMAMSLYLSSRHHAEAWVKGGYIQVDKLDFIKEDFLKGLMNMVTIKVGMDEINYGDAHFRRSDNARAIYNPFVGNYIMDAFTTEMFGELTIQKKGLLAVFGVSNGNLNQSVVKGDKELNLSPYGKLGYDQQLNDDLRVRLTGSFYLSPGYDNGRYLYSGDRTGARYYHVMEIEGANDNFRSGRYSPGFSKYNSFQINPFVKWKGLEFFGIYEMTSGDKSETVTDGSFTQIGTELIYRIGKEEKLFIGGRYNNVSGNESSADETKTISRINAGGGWFLTDNILMKAEYVTQNYSGSGWVSSEYEGGKFNGVVIEAVVGF